MTVKTTIKKTSVTTTGLLSAMLLATIPIAHAAPEVTINQPVGASTTIVEQSADGQIATITATPNGISMQNGMPFAVTQVTNVPRYTVRQGTSTVVTTAPITSQVVQQVGNTVGNTVVTTPINTGAQVLAVSTNAVPELTGQQVIAQSSNNQVTAVATVDTLQQLQLNPTFSTPGMANAQTKVMKILKNSTGQEFAVPANHIAPGDVIEYHTTYTNTTAQPLRDVNAVVSLPNGVKLVSLNSPLSTMGTIGGNSYQTIQQMGNSVVIQENYSGLKWNLVNLTADAPQTVVIRAQVQ